MAFAGPPRGTRAWLASSRGHTQAVQLKAWRLERVLACGEAEECQMRLCRQLGQDGTGHCRISLLIALLLGLVRFVLGSQ